MKFELENFSDEKPIEAMVEMHDGLAWLADALEKKSNAKQQFRLLHARVRVLELLNDCRQEWMRRKDSHPGKD